MKPWMLLSPKLAHDLSPWALAVASRWPANSNDFSWQNKSLGSLHFRNPLGIAGGVDKSGQNLLDWQRLGVGFLEVGTIVPKPQTPNPGEILKRDMKNKALWNRMGFPSEGAEKIASRLAKTRNKVHVPLFVNIGKNRDTPNELAAQDYIFLMNKFDSLASAFVVNISSPNTKGLRELLLPQNLKNFLLPIAEKRNHKIPILVKMSPDLSQDEIEQLLFTTNDLNFNGVIFSNTTLARPPEISFPAEGGLSGFPLNSASLKGLNTITSWRKRNSKKFLIVSCGGISNANDIRNRLELGADLLQVYSSIVFEGPYFFRKMSKECRIHQS